MTEVRTATQTIDWIGPGIECKGGAPAWGKEKQADPLQRRNEYTPWLFQSQPDDRKERSWTFRDECAYLAGE